MIKIEGKYIFIYNNIPAYISKVKIGNVYYFCDMYEIYCDTNKFNAIRMS